MNRYSKCFLVLALVCLFIIQGVAAFTVGNIAISPSSDLISGQTQVRSTFVINFPSTGGYTFDDENTLQLFTEMSNPTWTYARVQDGIENPTVTQVGQNFNIHGFELSYKKAELSMKVTLEAVAPTVANSEEKIVFAVRELNAAGAKIASSEVSRKKLVVNPAQIQGSISESKNKLSALQGQIDQLAVSGIDVSALQQKYNDASSAIQNAEKTSDITKISQFVTTANTALSSAETLASELGIQKTINDVDGSMTEVNALITDFKVNRSMTSDPRVTTLILQHDYAADLVSEAKDLLSEKKLDDARAKAEEAKLKADEALTQARDLKTSLDASPFASIGNPFAGLFSGGVLIALVVIVLIVVGIIGVYFFRKRRKWDELG
ncbi:MAG: hypothetical protein ACP5NN_04525 [Methanolinea sp.]|jgi:hypothetical protein